MGARLKICHRSMHLSSCIFHLKSHHAHTDCNMWEQEVVMGSNRSKVVVTNFSGPNDEWLKADAASELPTIHAFHVQIWWLNTLNTLFLDPLKTLFLEPLNT